MFKTPAVAEIPLPGIFGDSFRHWRVSMHSNLPWLHATLVTSDGDELGDRSEYVMVDDPITLDSVMRGLGDDQKITDVQVVSPPWMNKGRVWRMDPIRSVSIAKHTEGYDVHIYQLEAGGSLRLGLGGRDCESLQGDAVLVYSSTSDSCIGAL